MKFGGSLMSKQEDVTTHSFQWGPNALPPVGEKGMDEKQKKKKKMSMTVECGHLSKSCIQIHNSILYTVYRMDEVRCLWGYYLENKRRGGGGESGLTVNGSVIACTVALMNNNNGIIS